MPVDVAQERLVPSHDRHVARRRAWDLGLFAVCLAVSLFSITSQWSGPLLDQHEFRQTQNAIAVVSMLEGGPRLAYELPVLGKPWSLPFEFPLYHWLVMVVARAGVPVEPAGRLVSAVCFYAMLIPLLWLTRLAALGTERLVPLMLLLVSPLYLFWPRTFMIESLALLLAVSYFSLLVAVSRGGGIPAWTVTALCAVAASLAKVTTFVVMLVPAGFVSLAVIVRHLRKREYRRAAAFCFGSGVTVAGAIGVSAFWNGWADRVRQANPMADGFLTTDSLRPWLFGTWEQKTSWEVWESMFIRSIPEIVGRPMIFGLVSPLLFLGVLALARPRYRLHALVSLAAFLSGPAIFTNLYVVHNYYFFANGIFLLAFGAFGILTIMQSGVRAARMTRLFVLPLIVAGQLWSWHHSHNRPRFHPAQGEVLRFTATIREHTLPSDLVVFYGHDWNPALPYYSARRAFMDRWHLPLDDPKFRRAMKALEGQRFGAMVIAGSRREDQAFVAERTRFFGLQPQPALRHWLGDLYLRDR
jgi:hypothetical protein